MDATRRPELPLADALGQVGPTMKVSVAGRRFAGAPIAWQDWTLWQHAAIEEHYGSIRKWQRMWLGLPEQADDDADGLEQAATLVEKAKRINEGLEKQDGAQADTRESPLMNLGMEDSLPMRDQAFYIYVLLGPWEVGEDGERLLGQPELERGPLGWGISPEWVMANMTPLDLRLILAQIIVVQYMATAGELEGVEAEAGDHPKEGSSSPA